MQLHFVIHHNNYFIIRIDQNDLVFSGIRKLIDWLRGARLHRRGVETGIFGFVFNTSIALIRSNSIVVTICMFVGSYATSSYIFRNDRIVTAQQRASNLVECLILTSWNCRCHHISVSWLQQISRRYPPPLPLPSLWWHLTSHRTCIENCYSGEIHTAKSTAKQNNGKKKSRAEKTTTRKWKLANGKRRKIITCRYLLNCLHWRWQ